MHMCTCARTRVLLKVPGHLAVAVDRKPRPILAYDHPRCKLADGSPEFSFIELHRTKVPHPALILGKLVAGVGASFEHCKEVNKPAIST